MNDSCTNSAADAIAETEEHDLQRIAKNLEEMSDDLGHLQVGGALIHKLNNVRLRLLAQSRRLNQYVEAERRHWTGSVPEPVIANQEKMS